MYQIAMQRFRTNIFRRSATLSVYIVHFTARRKQCLVEWQHTLKNTHGTAQYGTYSMARCMTRCMGRCMTCCMAMPGVYGDRQCVLAVQPCSDQNNRIKFLPKCPDEEGARERAFRGWATFSQAVCCVCASAILVQLSRYSGYDWLARWKCSAGFVVLACKRVRRWPSDSCSVLCSVYTHYVIVCMPR